jgi:23S rRNA (uridine2552-2'-O)-methyltransferase
MIRRNAWMQRHVNDPYVKAAQSEGWRSRAAYKLLALHQRYRIFKKESVVLDIGCAPGSWSQVALTQARRVIGVDCQPIQPIPRLEFLRGDFTHPTTIATILQCLKGDTIHVLLSDMAPSLSGIALADEAQSYHLVHNVLSFAKAYLPTGAHCVIKVFHGSFFNDCLNEARSTFQRVQPFKPPASRSQSAETYLWLLK